MMPGMKHIQYFFCYVTKNSRKGLHINQNILSSAIDRSSSYKNHNIKTKYLNNFQKHLRNIYVYFVWKKEFRMIKQTNCYACFCLPIVRHSTKVRIPVSHIIWKQCAMKRWKKVSLVFDIIILWILLNSEKHVMTKYFSVNSFCLFTVLMFNHASLVFLMKHKSLLLLSDRNGI